MALSAQQGLRALRYRRTETTRFAGLIRPFALPNSRLSISETLSNIDAASYQAYGIALHKVDLYNYGGRPVIYGDNDVFNSLNDEVKYLWLALPADQK